MQHTAGPRIELEFDFENEVVHWRGPAPFFFVPFPPEETGELAAVAAQLTYGWGCIPALVTLGASTWETSIFPKDGGFLVPLKKQYRLAEGVDLGDRVRLRVFVASA